ncbi:MAG: single-stranded-DNA-specific exonuclease RecJ [Pseudomonadota bacterium]
MIRSVQLRRRRPGTPVAGHPNPVVARVLGARDLKQVPDYQLNAMLPPTLLGLEAASALVVDAILNQKRILVVGDFDADGATGTALAVRGLRGLGASDVHWRMPDRIRHGYGLSPTLATECLELKPDILITVDQGINSIAGIEQVRAAGVEVIVTDHHLPGPELPPASAIVNPNQSGDDFPSPHLAGVGVMFYLLIGVRRELRQRGQGADFRLDGLLDLVALGTVADLVQLDENNRRLVYQGLQRIRTRHCQPGVMALLEVAGRNLSHIGASDLGFIAGPRLNAAGRLDDISIGIRCLLADNEDQAFTLAQQLDQLNRSRQTIQADMVERAEQLASETLAKMHDPVPGLCLYDADWHPGVVGLVASRLCERLQRPVIALAPADTDSSEWKGSCRSPQGVHMRDLLVDIDARSPDVLDKFGGHARAAGLSVDAAQLEQLKITFDARVAEIEFAADEVLGDGGLSADELSAETAAALADAGPWGQGWEEPLFDGVFQVLNRRIVGQKHLKLSLSPITGGPAIDAIAFGAGDRCYQELPHPLRITYRLELNRWRGQVNPQLNIQHWVESTIGE